METSDFGDWRQRTLLLVWISEGEVYGGRDHTDHHGVGRPDHLAASHLPGDSEASQ